MRCIHNIDLDYWCYQCEADCMNPWDNMIEEAYRHNEAIRKLDLPDGWDCDCPICTGQDDDYSRD